MPKKMMNITSFHLFAPFHLILPSFFCRMFVRLSINVKTLDFPLIDMTIYMHSMLQVFS